MSANKVESWRFNRPDDSDSQLEYVNFCCFCSLLLSRDVLVLCSVFGAFFCDIPLFCIRTYQTWCGLSYACFNSITMFVFA